ncbi:MAG: FmdB family zinc ribbon protein [Nocardioides sp.]
MPTYQYACTACDHAFEQVQAFSDDSLTECPACHGKLRKVYNAVGVVFKGSGFYRNDSRSASEKSAAAQEAGTGSAGPAGAEGRDTGRDTGGDTKAGKDTKADKAGKGESSGSGDRSASGGGEKKAGDKKGGTKEPATSA